MSFKPNLYPVRARDVLSDPDFLAVVQDPELIGIFSRYGKNVFPSAWQKDEASYSVHCVYAPKDDLVFGTVTEAGTRRIACTCTNIECREFRSCRPEFDEHELDVLLENDLAAPSLAAFEGRDSEIVLRSFTKEYTNKWAATEAEEATVEALAVVSEECSPPDEQARGLELKENTTLTITDETELVEQHPVGTEDAVFLDNLDEEDELAPSQEQRRVIEASCDARLVVNAGPGRGKTFTLINRLKYLIEELEVEPESILVLSYSRAAVSVIRKRLSEASKRGEISATWQRLDLRTFDKFATWLLYLDADIHATSDIERKRKTEAISPLDYDQRIRKAASVIRGWEGLFDETAHVFVDETQDLTDPRTALVKEMLMSLPSYCGFTLLGDSCQSLFDYTVKNQHGAGTSEHMLRDIENRLSPGHYEFSTNYRQPQGLPYDIEALRSGILSKERKRMLAAARSIAEAIPSPDADLRLIDFNALSERTSGSTLGILTRTNGQALYISNLLRGNDVEHAFRPSGFVAPITRDLADVLVATRGETVDRQEFVDHATTAGVDEELAEEYWYGLVDCCDRRCLGPRYEVSALLAGLVSTGRRATLFLDPGRDFDVTVSTIHSSKGREFDEVWLLQEDLDGIIKPDVDLDEYKVAYVSLTRPRKELRLQRLGSKIRIIRFYDEAAGRKRCFKRCSAARTTGSNVSNLEMMSDVDLRQTSFACDETTQTIIREVIRPGDPLRLRRLHDARSYFPIYEIVTDDEYQVRLGITSDKFAEAFMKAYKKGKGDLSDEFVFKQFPEGFDDIYVDSVTTQVSTSAEAPAGARRFGDMAIWHGLSVAGFAKRNTQKY